MISRFASAATARLAARRRISAMSRASASYASLSALPIMCKASARDTQGEGAA